MACELPMHLPRSGAECGVRAGGGVPLLTFVRWRPALSGPGLWERAAPRGGAGAGPDRRSSSGTDLARAAGQTMQRSGQKVRRFRSGQNVRAMQRSGQKIRRCRGRVKRSERWTCRVRRSECWTGQVRRSERLTSQVRRSDDAEVRSEGHMMQRSCQKVRAMQKSGHMIQRSGQKVRAMQRSGRKVRALDKSGQKIRRCRGQVRTSERKRASGGHGENARKGSDRHWFISPKLIVRGQLHFES